MTKVTLWDEFWLELSLENRASIIFIILFFWIIFNSSFVYYLLGPKNVASINRLKIFLMNFSGSLIATYFISGTPTPQPDCQLQPKQWKSATGITSFFKKIVAQQVDEMLRLSWASLVKLFSLWLVIFIVSTMVLSFIVHPKIDKKIKKKLAYYQIILSLIVLLILHFSVNYLC